MLQIFCAIILALFLISCGDESNQTHNSDNSNDGSTSCEDEGCSANDFEFKLHPGGFTPRCEEVEPNIKACSECLQDSDCGENARCKEKTYCIDINQ
jgi:hypothetical protein